MDRSYRWGILGAGKIADKFCTALRSVEGSIVYSVASRDMDKARAYASRYEAERFYNNYNDLVNDDNVDIIYIATPHAFHYEQTMLCLQNKKAVLCEKPMSVSYRQTAAMIGEAERNKVFLMEGLWTVCMPFIEKIKAIIKEGTIGEPRYVTADFGFAASKDLEGRLYNKALGGGALLDIGIYPIALATLVLGAPSLIKSISKLAVTGVDEQVNILMEYPNGEAASLFSTLNFNTPVEAKIIGTKGYISIKSPWFKATDFLVHLNDGTLQAYAIPHLSNGFEHEITEVMHCLNNGLLQSSKVPHNYSLLVSKISDEVLRQAGVTYD